MNITTVAHPVGPGFGSLLPSVNAIRWEDEGFVGIKCCCSTSSLATACGSELLMFLKRMAGEFPLAGNLRLNNTDSSFRKTGKSSEVDVDTSSLICGNEFLIKLHQSDTN